MCRATIRARIALRAAAVCLLSPWAAASSGAPLVDMDLFTAGDRGYTCFRLPNLISLKPAGHMLAIVQGHKFDCSDGGRMDILLRRTVDSGRTWAPAEFVYGESTAESNVTMGTPTAVVDLVGDEASGVVPGTVFLFICRNFKHVLLLTSTNGGISWGRPRDLTKDLFAVGWTGVWTGLPQGLQLRNGRLIVCANHGFGGSSAAPGGTHSHTIYSDTHGLSWQNGKSVSSRNGSTGRIAKTQHMGECSLAETSAGIYMYARVWWDDGSPGNGLSTRALAFSTDGGENFSAGNTAAFPGNPGTDTQGAMAFANGRFYVGSPWGFDHFPRRNYTVLVSDAVDGRPSSWAPLAGAAPLWRGASEYSSILPGENETLWVMYERSEDASSRNGNEVVRLTQLQLPRGAKQ